MLASLGGYELAQGLRPLASGHAQDVARSGVPRDGDELVRDAPRAGECLDLVDGDRRHPVQRHVRVVGREPPLLRVLDGLPVEVVVVGDGRDRHLAAQRDDGVLESLRQPRLRMREERQVLVAPRVAGVAVDEARREVDHGRALALHEAADGALPPGVGRHVPAAALRADAGAAALDPDVERPLAPVADGQPRERGEPVLLDAIRLAELAPDHLKSVEALCILHDVFSHGFSFLFLVERRVFYAKRRFASRGSPGGGARGCDGGRTSPRRRDARPQRVTPCGAFR